MPNTAIAPNPPQFPETPQEYIKYLLKIRGISVQKMCDDLYPKLSKSTVDKWLSFQTTETSFSNVKEMVKYLGGSLDYLAQIEAKADSSSAPSVPPPQDEKKIKADYPALALLAESYEKEIHRMAEQHQQETQRISSVQEKYLAHVVDLVETGRQALITQHASAIQHIKELCDSSVKEKQDHLESFRSGRNFWRAFAVAMSGVALLMAVWLIWEFSNLDLGLTGYLLREAGLISMAGGGV